MNSYQQSTIPSSGPNGEETDRLCLADGTEASRRDDGIKPHRRLTALVICLAGVLVVAFFRSGSTSSTSSSTMMRNGQASLEGEGVALLGSSSSSKPAACTFTECTGSMCNPAVAPYTCLFHNGGVHGGCSPIPWTAETCTTQCDLSGCADLEIPDTAKDCTGDCTEDWCSLGRLCGSTAPYQCTTGASTFGCSTDKYHWTLRVAETACSSCCDTTTCEAGSN